MAYPQVQNPAPLYTAQNPGPRQASPSYSALWLLTQPSKRNAERLIRATRDQAYFEKWDRFTAGVGNALDVDPALTPLLGATLGAGLDLLFDRSVDAPGELPTSEPQDRAVDLSFLGHRLRRLGDPKRALARLLSQRQLSDRLLNARHSSSQAAGRDEVHSVATLDDAVAAILILTTLGGVAGDLEGRWLPFWQEWLGRTVDAQVASCGLEPSIKPSRRAEDSVTLAPYLEIAAATDMAALGIAGLAGFAPQQVSLIEPLRAILPALSRLVRVAADMAFDATEPVNCAVYLAAADSGVSLREARDALASSPDWAAAIEGRLVSLTRRELTRFLDASERSTSAIAALGRVVELAVLAEIDLVQSRSMRNFSQPSGTRAKSS